MTAPLAEYGFLPWVRRGLATRITRVQGVAPPQAEPRAALTFRVNFNSDALGAELELNLAGPSEVGGLVQGVGIRRVPDNDVHDAEPNYFPLLEFSEAELPWLHTPAQATANDRLTPWICLICLAEQEIVNYIPVDAEQDLAVVRVADASVLPRWDQLWAWAHAQVSGDKSPTTAELEDAFLHQRNRLVSRILAPRRLDPKQSYRAFVIPTFERGRLAGLGLEVPETLDALTPAWDSQSTDRDFPVYYEWRFQTGVAEDFEYLVRELKPFVMPPEVGRRDMDVTDPGLGLPGAAPYPLALEGALRAISSESTDWKAADRTPFVSRIAALLNFPDDALKTARATPIVAPPLYGRWHALRQRLMDAITAVPRWFHELNADPRLRVAAGLGTLVVQQEQRQLMASAWDQVGPIREINEERRKKQLAKLAAMRIFERNWQPLNVENLLIAAGPVLGRIRGSPRTVLAMLRSSPIATAAIDPALRRMARSRGPFGRRQGRADPGVRPSTMLDRMNRGELAGSHPPSLPDSMVTPARAGAGLVTPRVPVWLSRFLASPWLWLVLILIAVVVALITHSIVAGFVALLLLLFAVHLVRRRIAEWDRRNALVDGTLTGDQVLSAPPRPDLVVSLTPPESGPPPPPLRVPPPAGAPPGDTSSGRAFRLAAVAALERAHAAVAPGPALQMMDLPAVAATVRAALDPRVTIARGAKDRVHVAGGAVQPEDPVEEVMAAPEFPQPMYEPLRDLGQDWLLPGLDRVPANTISLLETNQAHMIEPYMLGLSHEMARELLWNGYPTDQRGTYFRQFWDVRGHLPPPGTTFDPEKLKDIKRIELWERHQGLGVNSARVMPPGGKHLVLLIRGDLLRRYPNTIIYAVPAVSTAEPDKHDLGSNELHPIFRGTLRPDVTFFGFELTAAQVRGTPGPDGEPGWFFVLQEQPAEPRFGLDLIDPDSANPYGTAPGSWNELSWGSLAATEAALKAITYIDLSAALPNTAGIETAAGPVWRESGGPRGSRASDLAYATLQVPVRIAIHGSKMLPDTLAGS